MISVRHRSIKNFVIINPLSIAQRQGQAYIVEVGLQFFINLEKACSGRYTDVARYRSATHAVCDLISKLYCRDVFISLTRLKQTESCPYLNLSLQYLLGPYIARVT